MEQTAGFRCIRDVGRRRDVLEEEDNEPPRVPEKPDRSRRPGPRGGRRAVAPGGRVHHPRPPARRARAASQRQVSPGQGRDLRPGGPDVGGPGLRQSFRPGHRGDLHLPRPRRRVRLRFRHVHRQREGPRRDPGKRRGPADLRGHRPQDEGPGPARVHRPQSLPGPGLSHPGPRRKARPDLLYRSPQGRERPRQVPLSAEHREVLARSARGRRHLRPDLEPGPHRQRLLALPQGLRAQGRRGERPRRLRGQGRPPGQGLPRLLLALEGRRGPVLPELGGRRRRLFHVPGRAALRRARARRSSPRTSSSCSTARAA